MNREQNLSKCSICRGEFRIIRVPGDKSIAPELVIENGEWKWVCSSCKEKLKGNCVVINKQGSYYDRNTKEKRDMIGITFKIKKKPNFYLDIVMNKPRATYYEKNFKKDPFEFLKRKGLEILLRKIEEENYISEVKDLSDKIKYKTQHL